MTVGREVPQYLDAWNGITYLYKNECDLPLTVYFETALAPTGRALVSLIGFGAGDVARGYFKPRGLRSRRHGRKGRKTGRFRGLPEIGNTIGRHLPGARDLSRRSVTQGVKNLWLLDATIQRGLYYMLIYDITTDFFIEWSSAIEEINGVNCRNHARMLREDPNGSTWGGAGPGFFAPAPLTDVKYQEFMTSNEFGANITSGKWLAVFAANARKSGPSAGEVGLRIFSNAGGGEVAESGLVFLEPGQTTGLVASRTFTGPATLFTQAYTDPGFAAVEDITFTVQSLE